MGIYIDKSITTTALVNKSNAAKTVGSVSLDVHATAMNNVYSLIVTTYADRASAREIANVLIANRLAASVQMLPVESVYIWQSKVCDRNEIVLFIRTKATMFDKITETIKKKHPYEVPEIIQLPIINGLPDYLQWIDECVEGRKY